MKARIFDIQHFSLHDGPGIRTTVFFKGCDLRCAWCANPESQAAVPRTLTDPRRCTGCGLCASSCIRQARRLREDCLAIGVTGRCIGCGACVSACPNEAIELSGRTEDTEAILVELLKDKPFYDTSGGGVTFSGGEVLLQHEVATELARALHAHSVHVAIETAANAEPERFRRFLTDIDLVQTDLKHWSDDRHREGTGVGNARILENIRHIAGCGIDYLIRIPVIPGFNASLDDAEHFAELLTELGVCRVQLLPFHQLGEGKYERLGDAYRYRGVPALHASELKAYREILSKNGPEVLL